EGQGDLDYRRDYTEDELVRVAMALPPDFPPGAEWSYSNTAYVLLGVLIHRVSGKFYGDVLRERIFDPLGMSSTRIISEADLVPNRAAGYRLEDGTIRNQEWVSPSLNTTADGSLYLTVLDLARWDAALHRGALLQPSSYSAMWTPVRLSDGSTFPYGFGWDLEEQRGRPTIEHGGSWQGFRSAIVRYPEEKLGVMVLSNLAQAEPESIAHTIAGLLDPALALPDPRSPRPDPDPRRTAAFRDVLGAWAAGRTSPRMAQGLGKRSASGRERESRKETGERLAGLESFSFLGEDDVRSRGIERLGQAVERVVHVGLVTRDAAFGYRFDLNAAGQVADFQSEER
ncbi:MAG TPA: serine hydrolase domain-containing protein, partial [Vicinamibacteria bacterium]